MIDGQIGLLSLHRWQRLVACLPLVLVTPAVVRLARVWWRGTGYGVLDADRVRLLELIALTA